MINHIRTLLGNIKQTGSHFDTEYIPADFIPRNLDILSKSIYQILFGENPDRLFINYRLHQIMQIMHATPLNPDIYLTDQRITYIPFNANFFDTHFNTEIEQLAGAPYIIHITGTQEGDTKLGRLLQIWDIQRNGAEIVVTKTIPAAVSDTYTATNENTINLMDSNFTVYLHDIPDGYRYRITSAARPTDDISYTMDRVFTSLGENGVNKLFNVNHTEASKWKNIWIQNENTPMKFTAAMLAYAYYIENLK